MYVCTEPETSVQEERLMMSEYYQKVRIVPEEAYPGLNYGSTKHNHGELDAVLSAYIKTIVDRKSQITPAWKEGFNGILDAYLG